MARQMKDSGIEWIGEIPEGWEVTKAKFILSANDGGVWGNDPADDSTDKIVIRSTEQTIDGKWCIDAPAVRDLSAVPHASSRILPGDLLITKSSGSNLHIGKTTLADDYFEKKECYFSNFIQRIRCKDYLPKLLWYLFNSNIVREQFVYLQNTTSGIGNINADIIDNLFLPNPSMAIQHRIADFLDRRCAEIDAVIERTKATIEEYKKLKQAVITEAVTKGVRGPRKMKDSGIEWIGEIPEEWNRNTIKSIAETCSGGTPTSNDESMYDGDINWVCSYDLHEKPIIESGRKITEAGANSIAGKLLNKGSVLIAMYGGAGTIGNSGILKCVARTNQAICSVKFNNEYVLDYYGFYYIMAIRKHWMMYAVGTRKDPNISQDIVRRMPCIIPPIDEQQEIVAYLDEKCAALDTLIAKKTALLTELETYKKSLIYEYVTGKKEVV